LIQEPPDLGALESATDRVHHDEAGSVGAAEQCDPVRNVELSSAFDFDAKLTNTKKSGSVKSETLNSGLDDRTRS
jgi:hypothetical protein